MSPSAWRAVYRRIIPLLVADSIIAAASLYFALQLRFEGEVPEPYRNVYLPCAAIIGAVQILFLALFRLYHVQWRYVSLREMFRVVYATVLSTVAATALMTFLQIGDNPQMLPRTVMIIVSLISVGLLGGIRILPRVIFRPTFTRNGRLPALIYGAGAAGEQIVRDMLRHDEYPFYPAGFVDDDPRKLRTTIHGLPVLGDGSRLSALSERTRAKTIIVALPSATSRQLLQIVERARKAKIHDIKILPGMNHIVSGRVTVNQVRKINLEDLMEREPVRIESTAIDEFFQGKRILITGAAGSIGSELVRQVLRFHPECVFLLDHDETELFHLVEHLRGTHGNRIEPHLADIRDAERIDHLFSLLRPHIVFHAAAYKNVPIIERYPAEAVKTNVFGTRNVARAALKHGAGKFILISSDKAVNPTSVMGVTKRIAEMTIREMGRGQQCRMTAVRFGNVLGSRGSVVPIFQDQIARGGPITVTHPDMKRYFMTVHEACLLVLQAAVLADHNEVFVLDMGEPVRIVDMAREMIRLSGFEPDVDISIVYSGIRPGEKLFEEYLTAEEGVDATRHQKIFVARISHDLTGEQFASYLEEFERTAAAGENDAIRKLFHRVVPTYLTLAPVSSIPPTPSPDATPFPFDKEIAAVKSV